MKKENKMLMKIGIMDITLFVMMIKMLELGKGNVVLFTILLVILVVGLLTFTSGILEKIFGGCVKCLR